MLKKTIRLIIITAVIMLIPVLASQFVDGFGWSGGDYIFASIMIFGVGALFELGRSMSGNLMYRAGFGLALLTGFMVIWGNGAVGFIGSEDNPANLMYGAVLLIAFLGSIISRFQAAGMARTMYVASVAMALVPVVALILNSTFQEIPEAAGVWQVFALNLFFVALWLGSGLLFRNAALESQTPSQA